MKVFEKKTLWILLLALCVICVCALAACNDTNKNQGDDPVNPNPTDDKVYHTVTIVSIKTQTLKVEHGKTATKPTVDPQKSGYKFEGWYSDGKVYDWTTPVTQDITIEAKYTKVLTVAHGSVDITDSGYLTQSPDSLFVIDNRFQKGSVSVAVTPGVEGCDCGLIFGVSDGGATSYWENATYYTVLINKDGVVLFSKINNNYKEITNSEYLRADYAYSKTYNLKVQYSEGLCVISVDGEEIIRRDIGELDGYGVGCRASKAGTSFGIITIDETDLPEEKDNTLGEYTVRSGKFSYENNVLTSQSSGSLAVLTEKTFNKGSITATVTPGTACDCGIIFGVNENGMTSYWEDVSYYMVLINKDGVVLFSQINNGYSEIANSEAVRASYDATHTYTIKVQYNEGLCVISVDGEEIIRKENITLYGTAVGVRTAAAGTSFGAITINEADMPKEKETLENYSICNGNFTYENDVLTSQLQNSLAVKKDASVSAGTVSVKVTVKSGSDNGIVFCLDDKGNTSFWETGVSYYFLFINTAGQLQIGKVKEGAWSNIAEGKGNYAAGDYTISATFENGSIKAYVNGELVYDITDNDFLTGTKVGVRAGAANVAFSELTVTAKQTEENAN